MANADSLDGNEAIACIIIFATELDAGAIGPYASNAFAIETCLTRWTDDRLVDAANSGIAAIVRAVVSIVTVDRRASATAAGARVRTGARVKVIARSALVRGIGEA